jgi:hypothetical protein
VLGLIDSVASSLNYWPVPAEPVPEKPPCEETHVADGSKTPAAVSTPAATDADRPLEDVLADGGQPSVA